MELFSLAPIISSYVEDPMRINVAVLALTFELLTTTTYYRNVSQELFDKEDYAAFYKARTPCGKLFPETK